MQRFSFLIATSDLVYIFIDYSHVNHEGSRDLAIVNGFTCDFMRTIHTKNPGILVLVAGDSDYSIPFNEAKKMKWERETWFWPKGMKVLFIYISGHMSTS